MDTTTRTESASSKLSTIEKVGTVIAVLVLLIIITITVVIIYRKTRMDKHVPNRSVVNVYNNSAYEMEANGNGR